MTGDEPQGTMSPSRLPLRAHFHQKRDVWVRGSIPTLRNKSMNDNNNNNKGAALIGGRCYMVVMAKVRQRRHYITKSIFCI